MPLSDRERNQLDRLANRTRVFNEALDGSLLAKAVQGADNISDLSDISGSDLTSVPVSFADLAAVQNYLAAIVPQIETRLDNIESKINEIINA